MKRTQRASLCILMVPLLLSSVFSGCGTRGLTELTIGIFSGGNWDVPNPNSYALFDEVIRRFEEEHPQYRVTYRSGTLKEDYSEWLAQRILSDDAPDVFLVLSEDFSTFASLGILQELDPLMEKDDGFDPGVYYGTALQAGHYQGKQHALPLEIAPTMMFVNKTLLLSEGIDVPSADWTWDDFYSICEQVTDDRNGDGELDQFGCYGFTWREAALTDGNVLFNADGTRCFFNTKPLADAVGFCRSVNALNGSVTLSSDDYDAGRVAFWPYLFSNYRAYKPYPFAIKKFSDFEWDCVPLPAGPNGGNTSDLHTLLMGVNARTSQKNAAWELLKFFTYDSETQFSLFEYSHGVSPLKEITESSRASAILQKDMPGDENFVDMKMLSGVIEDAYVVPNFKKYQEVMTLADNVLFPVVYGGANLETTLKNLQREISNALTG